MIRALITGKSGAGKSTVIEELAARGYTAIDANSNAWSEWVIEPGDRQGGRAGEPDWIWREDRIAEVLDTDDTCGYGTRTATKNGRSQMGPPVWCRSTPT